MSSAVSVVIPTYNRAELLADAIGSVQRQTFEDWELLVVDDGSTDDTRTVMDGFLADKRIRYVRQENRGQSAARNLGLRHARAPLIAFLDSDNRWLPDKLERQMRFLADHPEVDVVYGETERLGSDGSTWPSPVRERHSGTVWRPLLTKNFINFNTSVVRRERLIAIGGFDEALRGGEDYDLWLRLSPDCTFQFLPGVVTQYRIEGDRVTHNFGRIFDANRRSIDAFFESNPGLMRPREYRAVKARLYTRFARSFAGSGAIARGLDLALRTIVLDPSSSLSWRALYAVVVSPWRKTPSEDPDGEGRSGDGR